MKKYYAPMVDAFINARRGGLNPDNYSKKVMDKLNELWNVLSVIKSSECDIKRIFVTAQRGDISDYCTKEDWLSENLPIEDYESSWKEQYPEELSWYYLVVSQYNGYMVVSLNGKVVFNKAPEPSAYIYEDECAIKFLDWLIQTSKASINLVTNGKYLEYVQKKLPMDKRFGTILRKDLWKANPKIKEIYFEYITEEECQKFVKLMKDNKEVIKRIPRITANDFFEYCSIGYKANNYEDTNLSYVQQYLRHADGRDEGLSKLNLDSYEEFDNWYNDSTRFGGHPWEVCRGGNSTHINLYVCYDEGYYLTLDGKSYGRSVETIKFYLALYDKGLPVKVRDGEALAKRLTGEDKVGIVPDYMFTTYCELYFPDEKILDFMHLPYEEDEKSRMVKYVDWQEIEDVNI